MAMDDYRCVRCGRLPYRHEQPYPSAPFGGAYDEVSVEGDRWRKRRVTVCKGYRLRLDRVRYDDLVPVVVTGPLANKESDNGDRPHPEV